MLVQDKLQEARKTETATESTPTPRGRRPWLVAMVTAGALAGAAIVATVAGSDTDPAPTPASASDVVSYDVVEANRLGALRDLAVSGASYDVVEANRLGALRDLVVSGGSYDVVEANRMAALRDLAVSGGSYDVVEANRMAALRDLSAAP